MSMTKLEVIRVAAGGHYQKLKGGCRRKVLLDMFTASAITQVYDNLSPSNQQKFLAMPITMMADVAFKVIERAEERARVA